MTPIFELKIPPQAVTTNRMYLGVFIAVLVLPLIIFFLLKVVKPSLERNPINVAGVSIGIGFIMLVLSMTGYLVWKNFRKDAILTIATLYENGVKIGHHDVLIPYDEISAEIIR